MLFAHIVPTAYLEKLDKFSDCYLILEHVAKKDFEYRNFFTYSSKYKILDNGAYENGYPTPMVDLINMGDMLKADEIVLPDVFREAIYTKKHIETALDTIRKEGRLGDFKLMAVPQGKNAFEYLECLKWISKIKEVDVIGISFIIVKDCFKEYTGIDQVMPNRLFLTSIMEFIDREGKHAHLLGMGNCKEIELQEKHDWIRSADSSTCFVHGMNGIKFTKDVGLPIERITTKLDFDCKELPKDLEEIIEHNMGVVNAFRCRY